jgi:hypothetical protein
MDLQKSFGFGLQLGDSRLNIAKALDGVGRGWDFSPVLAVHSKRGSGGLHEGFLHPANAFFSVRTSKLAY